MQSYLKIMLWIYSLKISHCHSFSDKRHGKARGSGYRVNGKGGTMTQWGGGGVTYHQEVLFLCMLVCLHHAKKKNETIMATFTPTIRK